LAAAARPETYTLSLHDALPISIGHEARLLQHAQVLGDRGAADGKVAGDLADRQRTVDQALEDRPPRRVAERVELRLLVSVHLPRSEEHTSELQSRGHLVWRPPL